MHFNQCSRETMPVHYLHQKRSSIDLKQKYLAVNVTMVGGRGPRLVVRTTAIFVTMICVASFYGRIQSPAYEEPKIVSSTSRNIAKVSTAKYNASVGPYVADFLAIIPCYNVCLNGECQRIVMTWSNKTYQMQVVGATTPPFPVFLKTGYGAVCAVKLNACKLNCSS